MATGVTYDPEADALAINFGPGAIEGEEVRPGVILHYDADDRVVAIEVLHVSKTLTPGAIAALQADPGLAAVAFI